MKGFLPLSLLPFVPLAFLSAAEPIRVACLGDSITAGARVTAVESYPAQLQQMLGGGFVVKNFGAAGATLWPGGKPNAFDQLPAARAFGPKIVIVNFGINDTRSRDADYWSHFLTFTPEAAKLLDNLLALPSKPFVLLCLPTALASDLPGMADERKANTTERQPRLVKVREKWRALAASYKGHGVKVVDLFVVTEKHPEVFNADGVHLNAAGYKLLAETLRPHVAESAAKVVR